MKRFFQLVFLSVALMAVMLLGKPVSANRRLSSELAGQSAAGAAATKTWTTFFGGSGNETGTSIALDSKGNELVGGDSDKTWGTPLRPYTSGEDGFVAKLNPNGGLRWNTFLGTNGYDEINGIAVDADGNAYVVGASNATWGAPMNPYDAAGDAFVAKVDSGGALQWNTFLGGSAGDTGIAVAVDANGGLYVVGASGASWGAPVRPYSSKLDVFAAKLNAATGKLKWNTFLGGSGQEYGRGLEVDHGGILYVVGESNDTWGSPVRAYSAEEDAFAAKVSRKGVLKWNTFLGGSGDDWGYGVALDTTGNIFVAGTSTATWGSPTLPFSGDHDAQIAKLNSRGVLQANTFLGSSITNAGSGIATSPTGNVYVIGQSAATWGTPKRPFTAPNDAYAAKLNNSLRNLKWNTFLGGTGDDNGRGLAVDSNANVFVTGFSNASWGTPKNAYTSEQDVFIAKFH